eukprot:XP_001693477.1 predicted protein [Chlamydomonas reinhardtii]
MLRAIVRLCLAWVVGCAEWLMALAYERCELTLSADYGTWDLRKGNVVAVLEGWECVSLSTVTRPR